MSKFIQYFTKLGYEGNEFDISAAPFPLHHLQAAVYGAYGITLAEPSPRFIPPSVRRKDPASVTAVFLVTPPYDPLPAHRAQLHIFFHNHIFFPTNYPCSPGRLRSPSPPCFLHSPRPTILSPHSCDAILSLHPRNPDVKLLPNIYKTSSRIVHGPKNFFFCKKQKHIQQK